MQNPTTPPLPANQNNPPIPAAKIIGVLIVFLIVLKLALAWAFPPPQAQATDMTVENILNGINKERQLRNLLTLNLNQMLAIAAQSKTDDMIARHYFNHVDPEGNFVWPKIVAAGYTPYTQLGENLAIEFTNTESLISAWMASPTHRANILNEGFKDQGMGLGFGDTSLGQYRSAVANTFGALLVTHKQVVTEPQSTPPAPAITEQPKPAAKPKTVTPKPVVQKTPMPESTNITPSSTPAQTSSSTQAPRPPLAIRGEMELPSFATAEHTTSTPDIKTVAAKPAAPASRFTGLTANFDSIQSSRYITLIIGFLILILLLADLKNALQKKLEKIDKKINNLVLLALAIIVVALMYWL